MAEQVFEAAPSPEELYEIIHSKEDTPKSIQGVVSSLPSEILNRYKDTHEAVFNTLGTPSTQPLLSPLHSPPPPTATTQRRIRVLGWTKSLVRLWKSMKLSRYDENFLRVIAIKTVDEENTRGLVFGVAMIDYWSPYNMTSRDFGSRMVKNLESGTPRPLVTTLAGEARAIKVVKARWHCRDDIRITNPLMRFDPTMDESEFHIMERGDRFDIIIGRPDIIKFDILDADKRLALAAPQFFRSRPHAIDNRNVQNDEARAARERALEQEQMRQDAEHERYRDEYARDVAHRSAIDYAREYALLHGNEYYTGAYHHQYALQYPLAQAEYTQRYRRTT